MTCITEMVQCANMFGSKDGAACSPAFPLQTPLPQTGRDNVTNLFGLVRVRYQNELTP
jgi:hypothetical protein